MTQKEIDKFLADTKVYVNGKSKEIQEKLFSLGYKWCDACTEVKNTERPFLYIKKNHYILYGWDVNVFTEHEYREISGEEILSLKLTEPSYKPFKNKEECWNEMLKHQPFGWIKYKNNGNNGTYTGVHLHISCVYDSGIFGDSFKEVYEKFTFADNTPFGIKVE